MFTSFDISICTNHKLAASTHRFFNYFPKRIQIKCFELKNHQTSLVKSWSHITCDGKSQDFFFYPQYLCSVFFSHSFFFSCCFVVKVTQQFSIHIWERTFTSYARCRWTVLTCNLYMMAKKEKTEMQSNFQTS